MNGWALAVLPLVGVIVGALLQSWLSRSAARDRHLSELRAQAYVDYLRAVAAARHRRSDQDLRDAHRDAADAKARMAVYGSAEVIGALSRFEATGAILAEGPATDAFMALVSSMRPARDAVADAELRLVLLGPEKARPPKA